MTQVKVMRLLLVKLKREQRNFFKSEMNLLSENHCKSKANDRLSSDVKGRESRTRSEEIEIEATLLSLVKVEFLLSRGDNLAKSGMNAPGTKQMKIARKTGGKSDDIVIS